MADQAPWRHPKIVSTLLLVFVAGAFTGGLGMRLGLHERLHPPSVAASTKEASRGAVIQNFKTKLDLSPEQTRQIEGFLEEYRHYYENLEDQLDDMRSTGKKNILTILNPSQREKFEKMMAELAPQLQSK
jgi:hypothetical protein